MLNTPIIVKNNISDTIELMNQIDKSNYRNIKDLGKKIPKCYGDLWESVAAALIFDGGYQFIIYINQVGKHLWMFMVECTNRLYSLFAKILKKYMDSIKSLNFD